MKINIETPNIENVVYIDEYPEAAKRVWLRRLAAQRLSTMVELPRIIPFQRGPQDAS